VRVAVGRRPEGPPSEPARARYPDRSGYAERGGVRLFWELYGDGEPTLLFACPGPIVQSRLWKGQVAYLARHARVLVYDPRGGGQSDRPRGAAAYSVPEMAQDALAVMDAAGIERTVIVTTSGAARAALWLLANHPDRFSGAVFVAPFLPLTWWGPVATGRRTFEESSKTRRALRMAYDSMIDLPRAVRSRTYRRFARQVKFSEALDMYTRDALLHHQRRFLEWNMSSFAMPEAHSTKQIEDAVGWGMETDGQALADAHYAMEIADEAILKDRDEILAYCSRVCCPVLVINGAQDVMSPPEWGVVLAEATGGRRVVVDGCGHIPQGRKPVAVNLALLDFARSLGHPEPG
jgi:pimeloyl-ACP methyl ester carboxylesterase